jgi:hypothetical protein
MNRPELVTATQSDEEAPIALDRLHDAWRRVMAARTSARHFKARLRRTTAIVAEMAPIDPQLARAMGVLTALMANVSLAEGTLGALPMPDDLVEADMAVIACEQDERAETLARSS